MNKRKERESVLSKLDVAALSDDQLEAIEKIINKGDKKKNTLKNLASANEMETSLQNIMMVMKPFAVAITDVKGFVIMRNETMIAMLGDLLSENTCIFEYKHFHDVAGNKEMEKLKRGETVHIDELWYNKGTDPEDESANICVHILIFPLFNSSGEIKNFVIIHVDITLHKLAEQAWKETEEKFNLVFENNMQAVFYECDMEGKVLDISPSIEFISKYNREEMIGKNMRDIYFDPKDREELMKEIKTRKRLYDYLIKVKDKDGKVLYISVNTKLISDKKGNPKKIMGVITDVTPLHKTSFALRKSEERYHELFDIVNDMIITMDLEGNFTSLNPAAERLLGHRFEDLPSRKMASYLSPESEKLAYENIKAKLTGEKTSTIYEVDVINKDGSYTTLEINSQLRYKDGNPYEIFGIARNISDRKKASEELKKSEEKYKLIFENAPLGIMTADIKGNLIEINPTLLQLLGSKSIEQTKNINVLNFPPLIESGFVDAFKRCIKYGKAVTAESSYTSKWGVQLEAKVYVKPLKDHNGKVFGFQTIVEDISEQKKADRKIKTALAEKEILIREIHHRVKNNMQVIISLINMQTYNNKDKQMISKLNELQQRVRTMAIIHEDLYKSDDLAHINFGEYMNKLVKNLLQIYPRDFEIELKFNIENTFLDINTAIPCGLIVNELLTNSFKHAFPDNWRKKHKKKNCEIFIEFRSTNNNYYMVVGDNGIGISENNNVRQKDTLGLELVEILVGQMRGTMKKFNTNGTKYKIGIDKRGRN